MDPNSNDYYVLISGRWFKGKSLDGEWTYVANDALPADFAKISPEDPKASVLVSVAGTQQAKEAAIAATIPQTATVKRTTTAKVSYDGEPKFVAIPGTTLKYAVNTPQPVIEVNRSSYYMVSQGIWFTAKSPAGPWTVATFVPGGDLQPSRSPRRSITSPMSASIPSSRRGGGGLYARLHGRHRPPGGTVVYGTGYTCNG